MREWIVRVMTAAVLSAVLELLAPEGRMRRYVSFGIAAVLLAVLLSPLGTLKEGLPALPPLFELAEPSGNADAADGVVLSLAEAALVEHLAERFSLSANDLRAKLTYSEDKSTLRLVLTLPRGAPLEEIRAYLASETSLECEVIFYQD